MAQQLTPVPMRFVDLFCGGGLASRGLVQAGMKPMGGIDHWPVAVESYRENFEHAWRLEIGPDCQRQPEMSRLGEAGAGPELVWLSPPCTEFSNAKGATARNEAAIEAAVWGAELAAFLAPAYVVLENHPAIVRHPVFDRVFDVFAPGYGGPQVHWLDAHLFAGSPAARSRAFVIWTRRGHRPPELFDQPERAPVLAESVIDWSLPLTPGHEGLSAEARAAIDHHLRLWRGMPGIYRYFKGSRVVPIISAFPTITTTQRYLLVTPQGRRFVTLPEIRRAMGLPACHVLRGNQKEQFKQVGNGVDVRVAEAIGQAIVRAHAGIEARQG